MGKGFSGELQKKHLEEMENKKKDLEDVGFTVKYEAPIGFPPAEIIKTAHKHESQLIVIGSRGKNIAREIFLGSTVSGLIRITTLPTLLERIELVQHLDPSSCSLVCKRKFKSLLVPTDFSSRAREAENVAIQLAPYAEKLVFVSVIDEGDEQEEISKLETETREKLKELKQQNNDISEKIKISVATGIPSQFINQVAKEEESTLIIMGTRGKGRLAGLKLGSTAENVSRYSKRPVLLVPEQQNHNL